MEVSITTPPALRRARALRKRLTEPERLLWGMLRGKQIGLRFRREHPIGPYVVDFYCAAAKLCVEVDGPVHDEPSKDRDATRDAWLSSQGFLVLRFSSTDVEESPAQVIARIKQAAPPPSP